MKNTKLLLLTCLMTLIGWNATAQRVIAYHQPSNNDKLLDWYWDYITDINYSFLQVSSSGQVGLGLNGVPASKFEQQQWDDFVTKAQKYGKRISISVGGASKSQALNFKSAASTDAKAKTFATNLIKWANDRGLDGVDIDWEPEGGVGAPTSAEWIRLLSALRSEINSVKPTMELSAAVFPYKWNNDFITPNSHSYVDHFNLMVYDFGGQDYPHHSNYVPNADRDYGGKTVEEGCVSYWNKTKGLDKTKIVLGLPFYARSKNWGYSQTDYKLYRDVLALGGSATADEKGNWMYNGQTTIKRKTQYMMDNGLKGVMMWEIAGDATSKDKSLLASIDEIIGGECQKPNAGESQNICGKQNIVLDASLNELDYTFEWQKDGNAVFGGNKKTYEVTAPGTYKVIATKKGTTCSRESAVIITSDYPELAVFDVPLCGEGDQIEVDGTIEGFENMNYKWTGPQTASTAKISISEKGSYTLEVSDPFSHCETKTKVIEANESTVPVEGDAVCQAGDEAHVKVTDGGTGYTWWDAETGGNLLGSENELYKTVNGNTTFYVQKTGGAVQYDAGLKYDHADPADEFSGPGNGDYEWAPKDFDDLRLYFTAQQQLTIDQVTAHLDVGFGDTYAPDIKVCLYDGDGKEIECKDLVADNGKNDLSLGFNIEPGNYYIGIPTTKNWGEKGTEDSPIDYNALGIDGILTLNSTVSKNTENYQYAIKHWYAGLYDIKVSTGKPCPRVPVEVTIDESQTKCIKHEPTIKITKPGDKQSYKVGEDLQLVAEAADKDSEIDEVTFMLALGGNELPVDANKGVNGDEYIGLFASGSQPPSGGTFTFTATVKTKDGQTATDVIEFTLTSEVIDNQPPTVSITKPSNNSEAKINSVVTISANANDTDGTVSAVEYLVTKDGKTIASLQGSGSSYESDFTPTEAGTYTIKATATDNKGATGTDEITITVKEGDVVVKSPPSVSITTPSNNAEVAVNTAVNITANATDTDGTVSAVLYLVTSGGKTIASLQGSGSDYAASFTPTEAGTYTIKATATDNDNLEGTNEITITVKEEENEVPVITINKPANTTIKLPNAVEFDVTATDADGTIQSVTATISGNNQDITLPGTGNSYAGDWTPAQTGTYTITFTATDDKGATATKEIEVTILDANSNVPPTIVISKPSTETVTVLTGETVDIEATVTDEDGTVSSVTINGENVQGSGDTYSSTFSSSTPTTKTIEIVATDDKGATSTKTITVVVEAPDTAPDVTINSPADGSTITLTNSNKTVDINVTATDNSAVSSVVIKVDGQTVSSSNSGTTYTASYTPNGSGTVQIEVTATDDKGKTTTEGVTVTIKDEINTDASISINKPSTSDNVSIDDTAVEIDITSTDSEGVSSVKVEAINGNNTSTISTSTSNGKTTGTWNPTEEGTYTIQVTVTDNKGNTTVKTMTIQVKGANELPVITLNDPKVGGKVVEGSVLIGTTIDLSATVSHNGDNVETIFYKITQTDPTQEQMSMTRVGKASNNYATTWVVNGPGTFSIVATAADPDNTKLEATSETKTLTVKLTNGLAEENAAKLNFVVAPNPAVDYANVSFELVEGDETTVSIYNAQGQIVTTVVSDDLAAGTHTVTLEVSDLPSGVYFIQLVTGDTLAIQRLIVE